jgi:hypothetical protein
MARRPADPEEELRWMSQEVRGYVEAVLNSLAANVPKVHIPASVNIYGFMYLSNFFLLFSMLFRLLCFAKSRKQRKTCLTSYTAQ